MLFAFVKIRKRALNLEMYRDLPQRLISIHPIIVGSTYPPTMTIVVHCYGNRTLPPTIMAMLLLFYSLIHMKLNALT